MNLTKFFSIVLVMLHCNIGIACLKVTLDGFEFRCLQYIFNKPCNITARITFLAAGRIVLNVGEQLPNYIRYERQCPPSEECWTHDGTGSWTRLWLLSTQRYCPINSSRDFEMGCYLLSERTYGFYLQLGDYYTSRLCKLRVQPCDNRDEAHTCGPFSDEHNVSEISTEKRYGYDTSVDEQFRLYEKECRERQRAARNGKEEKRRPSDDFLMIFGVVLAINMIVFC